MSTRTAAASTSSSSSDAVASAIHEAFDDAEEWNIQGSRTSQSTINPLRRLVESLKVPQNHPNRLIMLSLGDPTAFNNFHPPQHAVDALVDNIRSAKFNGYQAAAGLAAARQAIATLHSNEHCKLTPNDIYITSGCSHALYLCLAALCGEDDNVLMPQPCFPLYETICQNIGATPRFYRLTHDKPQHNHTDGNSITMNGDAKQQEQAEHDVWSVDIAHMCALIDSRTRCIMMNNPGNPTGSNFSRSDLLAMIGVARKYHLPIIADEVYWNMVFAGETFTPLASLSADVPIFTVAGISKMFVVPGWRVGWLCIHDPKHKLAANVRVGLDNLSQILIGANVLMQSIIPTLLNDTPASYSINMMNKLQRHAFSLYDRLVGVRGIEPVKPQGAMYLLVRIVVEEFGDDIPNDTVFSRELLTAENVFVMPAGCFRAENYVRLVFCANEDMLIEAADRMVNFCKKRVKPLEQVRPRKASLLQPASPAPTVTAPPSASLTPSTASSSSSAASPSAALSPSASNNHPHPHHHHVVSVHSPFMIDTYDWTQKIDCKCASVRYSMHMFF